MKEIKVGDTVLVPAKIFDETSAAYWVKYGTESFWVSKGIAINYQEDKSYDDGLNDAWEAAKKVLCVDEECGMQENDLNEIFGDLHGADDILMGYTAQEVIKEIKAWKDKNEIHVGDIVEMIGGIKGLVTKVKDGQYNILYSDGGCRKTVEGEKLKKTGKDLDLAFFLSLIK